MAANQRELTVKFSGDTSDLTHAAEQSEKALGGMGKAASGPGGLLSKLTPVIDPVSLLQQGISGLVSAGLDFAQAAIDDAKSSAALDGVLRQTAHATREGVDAAEAWISKMSIQVGIADDELRPAFGRLATATGDVKAAQDLFTLALDTAAGRGKDFNAVADAMVKAQNGNVGALAKLGVQTKDTAGNTKSFADIVADLHTKYDGLAEKVADKDPLTKMRVAWDEVKESLGAFVVPGLVFLAHIFTDVLFPAVQWVTTYLKAEWPTVKAALKPAFDELGRSLDVLAGQFGSVGDASKSASATSIIWAQIAYAASIPIKVLAKAVEAVTDGIVGLKFAWAIVSDYLLGPVVRAVGAMEQAFAGLAHTVASVADGVMDVWHDVFRWIAKTWNATLGKLSFHIPGTSIGFDVPSIPVPSSAVPAPSMAGGGAAPTVVIQLPTGTDARALVSQLRNYGVRVGGIDLATVGGLATR